MDKLQEVLINAKKMWSKALGESVSDERIMQIASNLADFLTILNDIDQGMRHSEIRRAKMAMSTSSCELDPLRIEGEAVKSW